MARATRAATEIVGDLLTTKPVTASDLAERGGLGKSTVTKALATLESGGRAQRAPGGRDGSRRLPDLWTAVTAGRRDTTPATASRLRRGELRAAVLAYLQAHDGEAFSPTAIAKALGRSAGAIGNAAETLVQTRQLVRVSDSPRRYRTDRGVNGQPQA